MEIYLLIADNRMIFSGEILFNKTNEEGYGNETKKINVAWFIK